MKPLAGKRFFEAQGRSAYSRGLPLNAGRFVEVNLPMWARSAWARGWIIQGSSRQMTESIVSGFEKRAEQRGVTLDGIQPTISFYWFIEGRRASKAEVFRRFADAAIAKATRGQTDATQSPKPGEETCDFSRIET